jgi:outer membrane protein assembly factor BamB
MRLALLISGAVLAQSAVVPPSGNGAAPVRVSWLLDLGAESILASPTPSSSAAPATPIIVPVPGAVYVFTTNADGALQRSKRLAADPAAPYGLAVTDTALAVVNKDGVVSVWNTRAGAAPTLRWWRELRERATSIAWDGGERVMAATWQNRLFALHAGDGHVLWAVDIGGRAEAPPLVVGTDVLVATKAKSLVSVDATTGTIRWKIALPGLVRHPLARLDDRQRGLAICGTWEGELLAYEIATGRLRWSATLPAKLAGGPLAGPDFVGAVTADGTVHLYDSAGQPRWSRPGSAEGPATLAVLAPAGVAPKLLVVSRVLAGLDLDKGAPLDDYPRGAVDELKRRFADAMLDGVKTFSEGEKHALLEKDAFDIQGPLFGAARLAGSQLGFGTEDGWAYLFDGSRLRPLARYRTGQTASSLRAGSAYAIGVAGDQVFGLDAARGRVAWTRGLGAEPTAIAGETAIGVVAGGRVQALDPKDGVPRWSLRGTYRSVAPPPSDASDAPWLADDGAGELVAVAASAGRTVGEPLPAGGELLPIPGAGTAGWTVGTREGKVYTVSWQDGARLVTGWERNLGERLSEIRTAGERTAVRTESGVLIALGPDGQDLWRIHLAAGERFDILPQASSLVASGGPDIRVYDWMSGATRLLWKVDAPPVAADVRGASLVWLDRIGTVYKVDMSAARLVERTNLDTPLAAAATMPDGFLMATAAGEVGFVEFNSVERGEGR